MRFHAALHDRAPACLSDPGAPASSPAPLPSPWCCWTRWGRARTQTRGQVRGGAVDVRVRSGSALSQSVCRGREWVYFVASVMQPRIAFPPQPWLAASSSTSATRPPSPWPPRTTQRPRPWLAARRVAGAGRVVTHAPATASGPTMLCSVSPARLRPCQRRLRHADPAPRLRAAVGHGGRQQCPRHRTGAGIRPGGRGGERWNGHTLVWM